MCHIRRIGIEACATGHYWTRELGALGHDVRLMAPSYVKPFRRMHLNQWTEQAERWIDPVAWDACDGPVALEQLRGRTCFGGLDLSTTTDVSALAWVFPPEEED